MTTDPFTTADDRWDESPHHLADQCEHAGVGKACRRCRRKFDASAQWARTYLAEQEPDHTIEAVTITALASRHYVEDEETGKSDLHPVYGNRSSIEIMLPEGASLPRLTLGGEWTITLARAVGRDAR